MKLRFASLLLALVSSVAAAQETIRVVHVGDINLARTVARRYILGGRGGEVFAGTQDFLRSADIAIGNLESVLIDRGAATDSAGSVVFAGPAEGARLLRDAGLDIIVTANNHSWDVGLSGLLESRTHLSAAGLLHAGTAATLDDAFIALTGEELANEELVAVGD